MATQTPGGLLHDRQTQPRPRAGPLSTEEAFKRSLALAIRYARSIVHYIDSNEATFRRETDIDVTAARAMVQGFAQQVVEN